MSRLVSLLVLCAIAVPADACRCAQRNLADYFHAASEVVIGRLVSAVPVRGESQSVALQFELAAPPYKSQRRLGVGDRVTYLTATSSAACGITPDKEVVYVLFALETGDAQSSKLHVDTCSGSRAMMAGDGRAAAGFQDVPAPFVPQQLNALAALPVLSAISAAQPNPDDPSNDKLIGLLDVAGFSHAGHALLLEQPRRNAVPVAKLDSIDALSAREVGYETPAAVVYATMNGWYRLKTRNGEYGWLPPEYAGTYFPYDELLIRRLAYLPLPWHGFVWPSAGAGLPMRARLPDAQREQPVEIVESALIGGSVWFRVNVLKNSPCDGGTAATSIGGWIPAFREDGTPIAWFYSRGC